MLDTERVLAVWLRLHNHDRRAVRAYILEPHKTDGHPIWASLAERTRTWS